MSEQAYRRFAGGRIDRSALCSFEFDGQSLNGFAGDTLASALLANGIHLVGRSFKYHRPRGVLSAGAEEPNALVQVGAQGYWTPNLRATQVELYEGLGAHSQNCWPSLNYDVGEINNVLSRAIPAGFYYKTFMWPASYWMKYEYFIRKAAGLGRAPAQPDPDHYDKAHIHCDVLVVGAGPAGLAAAHAAGRTGARVIVADDQSELGGSLLSSRALLNDGPATDWATATAVELASMSEVRVLPRTTVAGYFDHNYLTLLERVTDHLPPGTAPERPRQRLWKVRAGQVILATGAHERPMVFENNDRPGIMMSSAVQTYLNRYAVVAGNDALIYTNNDSAYAVAMDLSDAGVSVTVADTREQVPTEAGEQLARRGVEILSGYGIVTAKGYKRVRAVELAKLDASGTGFTGAVRELRCDLIAMSGGWNPTVHLFSQSRGRLLFDPARACFVPGESVQRERSAGASNGTFQLAYCLSEGREAGKAAAAEAGFRKRGTSAAPRVAMTETVDLTPFWLTPARFPGGKTSKHFVDFQNDVTAADIALAAREGYRSVEHLKRYTTMGMGTDQGKTSNVNALALLARELGAQIPAVGTTTFRPPYTPVTFGALAGRDLGDLMDPIRVTPMHPWHVAHGAAFEDVGQWKRPWYYARGAEDMHAAVNRECRAARSAVAILDATTLGKIDIQGTDAGDFLDRIYTNGFRKLGIGRCRYGLMCSEDGMVFDDGVTTRLGENHYLMSTTSGNAARVLAWLEEWLQTEWPELDVYCCSVTEQYATASISGPLARALLGEVCTDIDLDNANFPFMSVRTGTVAGLPARVSRISFTGELGYEIAVAAGYGQALWDALMLAGDQYGITPYGTEAMHLLRAEKGFIIAGQDTDGTMTPIDLDMDWIVAKHKDFIGRRSLSRADTLREDRKQLVGLLTVNPDVVLPEGAQIVAQALPRPPMQMQGHVTSSYWSPTLGRSIALAVLTGGRNRHGESVELPLEGGVVMAKVTSPVFFDVDGERMRG